MWDLIHNHREDLQALGPIATIIAAVLALLVTGLIGVAQWRIARAQKDIARDKVRLDLFDRRYAIYSAAKSLANDLRPSSTTRISYEMHDQWINKTSEAPFFFSHIAAEMAIGVRDAAIEWAQNLELLQMIGESDESLKSVIETRQIQIPGEMQMYSNNIDKMFYPELTSSELSRWERR